MNNFFGDKALELIREHHRNKDATLAPYNEEKVRQVLEEIQALVSANQKEIFRAADGSSDASNMTAVEARHHGMMRNQRCLVAYAYNRLEKVKNLRWEFGSVVPADIKSNMSEMESQWFSKYNRALAQYMGSYGEDGLDLTQGLKPPEELHIEVRCVEERGEMVLESGKTVLLKHNSMHYLPRSECESLIREGVLVQIK